MTSQTPEGKRKRASARMEQGGAEGSGGGGGNSSKRLSAKQQRKQDEEDVQQAQQLSTKARAEMRREMNEIHKNIQNVPVEESLDKLNVINMKIGHTRELYKNTEVVADLAHLTEQRAVELAHAAKRYDWKRFVAGLKGQEAFIDGKDGLNWIAIGAAVAPCFRSIPECEFLLGPLEKSPKEKTVQKGRKRRKDELEEDEEEAELVRPGEVAKDAAKETEDIGAKRVKMMLNVMKSTFQIGQGRTERQQAVREVDAFNFMFDPNSFTQTVENIFDLSFLCKERQAAFALNEEGVPVVRPSSGRTSLKNTQAVLSLSMAEWQELVEAFGVEDPTVPHRPNYKKDEALARMLASSRGSASSSLAAAAE